MSGTFWRAVAIALALTMIASWAVTSYSRTQIVETGEVPAIASAIEWLGLLLLSLLAVAVAAGAYEFACWVRSKKGD